MNHFRRHKIIWLAIFSILFLTQCGQTEEPNHSNFNWNGENEQTSDYWEIEDIEI